MQRVTRSGYKKDTAHSRGPDKILIIALLLGFLFSLYGIQWGRVESWNPDQMALRTLSAEGKMLKPNSFYKPPFHTYFNYFLSHLPLELIQSKMNVSTSFQRHSQIIWPRLLTAFLFSGSIILVYKISKSAFGIFPARILSLIFSTSAGLIAYTHFLTADIPVMFWMLSAFYFSQRILSKGKLADYVLAGFFTGIATATKYNGLAVGFAIVVAHFLSFNRASWKSPKAIFLNHKLFCGLVMVPLGFLLANPYALFDHAKFLADFVYNYKVTPSYGGQIGGHGYIRFFWGCIEVIGYFSFATVLIAMAYSGYFIIFTENDSLIKRFLVLCLSLSALYFLKIGSFPRLETRFVLPILPFLLMASGQFWNRMMSNRKTVLFLLTVIVGYNLICDTYVGKRFVSDPRMDAQQWVQLNVPTGSSMEVSPYSPRFDKLPGVQINIRRTPFVSGRLRIFEKRFKDDLFVLDEVRRHESGGMDVGFYSIERLRIQKPDYVVIDSLYYDRFFDVRMARLYPSIKSYFQDLLHEKYPYRIVFDEESEATPEWVYPRKIDFLQNRLTILKRIEGSG